MFKYTTPEKKGISSKNIERFIRSIEARRLSTHDMIIMRGDEIVFEHYWKPFNNSSLHRMYSVTKSLLSIAVGFAIQEGVLSLDDKVSDHLPKESSILTDSNMRELTLKNLIMMSTAKEDKNWFVARHPDRVKLYFENDNLDSRPGGTIYYYDSHGSFVLGAILENAVGMPFIDYLRTRLFDKIGISKEAHALKCPGGHSWSDSSWLATARDLLTLGRFTLNMGKWNGEQILDEGYLREATAKQIDNNCQGLENFCSQGYGYLIWRTYDDSFFFYGMGCQLCVCVPEKDIIFVYNGDNQGNELAAHVIMDGFFDFISRTAEDGEIPEDSEASASLAAYVENLSLYSVKDVCGRAFEEKINGKKYILNPNFMGIKNISFNFTEGDCEMNYTNAQGEKTLKFRIGENAFGFFPEEGYSKEVGSQFADGNYYKCAASGGWIEEKKLFIRVQIIDDYFGILNMNFGFKDENTVGINMNKAAEDFLTTYEGYATGVAEQ